MSPDMIGTAMTDETNHDPSLTANDALALVSDEAAVGVVGAVAGATFGPLGAITAALLSPFAVHAARRIRELAARINEDTGLKQDEIRERLVADERLADLVACAVRAAIESDLRATRRLLARAVVEALKDDAKVDVEARFVRAAAALDTVDVRVLAVVGDWASASIPIAHIGEQWAEGAIVVGPAVAALVGEGLLAVPAEGSARSRNVERVRITSFGMAFLDRLRAEGEEELPYSGRPD